MSYDSKARTTDPGPALGEPTNTESSATGAGESLDPANTEGSREPKTTATSSTGPDLGAAAPESGAQEFQKQQGADRPHEAPEGAQADAVVNEKKEAENAMSADTSGDTTSGGGPIAGGDETSGGGPPPQQSQGGQKENLGSTSKEPGTGTKYEKSTGMAAEGGDFDATRPGAGKEADRKSRSLQCWFLLTLFRSFGGKGNPSWRQSRSSGGYSWTQRRRLLFWQAERGTEDQG